MKTETGNKQDEAPDGGAVRDCPDSAGSVGCLGVFSSMLEMTTDAAHFYGDDLVKLKASIKAALEDCNRFYWLMDNASIRDYVTDDAAYCLQEGREAIDAAIHSQNTESRNPETTEKDL
jgi:hypothetical protein